MARAILLAGALTWILAGMGALVVAVLGTGTLERLLPPLLIDTDALRGAVTALGAALLAVGLTHLVVLIGLRGRRRWGWSAGILMAALLAALMLTLAAAAATSAVATPELVLPLLGAGVVPAVAAAAYALAGARLAGERRSGSAP